MSESPMARALKLALALFSPGPVDSAQVIDNCDSVLMMLELRGEALPDRTALIKEVESRVVVYQEQPTSLEDRTGHHEWLAEARSQITWRFWDRYRRYLEQVDLLPPTVIGRLDDSSDQVLSKLESPARSGSWDRRGLVVGQVQSGKTGHYSSLVCKAADAGYKLIVVLAGMHNSLRSQTQLRLDEALLGFDSQYQYRYDDTTQSRMGVGTLPGAVPVKIGSLTTSHDGGDFKKSRANNLPLPIGDMPVLLVTKKHGGILDNLIKWVTQLHGVPTQPDSKKLIVRDIPLLVIDDEADTASVNTKSVGEDPAVINQRIRDLLTAFDKSAYVGYTATPFANIFSSTTEDDEYGLDLFPRHFIESLKPPSNYFGPARVFGLPATAESEGLSAMPIFHDLKDHHKWIPDKHKAHWSPPDNAFPKSLEKAILSFFLTCAARAQRGDGSKHNSMLIHVTRYKNVQNQVRDQVEAKLLALKYRVRYGDGDGPSVWDDLRRLWEDEYIGVSRTMDPTTEPTPWQAVQPYVKSAVGKIQIRTINGDSSDALEYYENREKGLSVIAIGGDKLSRGLTLDGLSISYYLRASRMYDTLMQMGRWFGYRPKYEDLCRLYTTSELRSWYREITQASEELRRDFDDMAARPPATPEDYGLRVRQSPAGLSITAPNKMRNSSSVRLTFTGEISESVTFDLSTPSVDANVLNLQHFYDTMVEERGQPERSKKNNSLMWRGVSGETVANDFFTGYRADKRARRARPELIARYIRDGLKAGELVRWSVMIVNNSQSGQIHQFDPSHGVGLTLRKPLDTSELEDGGRYTIRRLLSPADESVDLTTEQFENACVDIYERRRKLAAPGEAVAKPEYPYGPALRSQRSPEHGLLVIYPLTYTTEDAVGPYVGFAASFPFSRRIRPATYKVNEIWSMLAFDELDDPDD